MNFSTTEAFLSKINQKYNLILAAPLIVFSFLYLEKGSIGGWAPVISNYTYNLIILYSLSISSIVLIGLSFKNFKEEINKNAHRAFKERIEFYYTSFINQQILLTTGGLIAILGVYLTGYHLFSVIYLLSLFISSIQRPSNHRVIKVLGLKDKEKEAILKKLDFPK